MEKSWHELRQSKAITLSAKVKDKKIWVFCIGRWRAVRYYGLNRIPSAKIQKECIRTIWLNTGRNWPIEEIGLEFIQLARDIQNPCPNT